MNPFKRLFAKTPEKIFKLAQIRQEVDDELNIKIKKVLRQHKIEPTNKIIKAITRVDCKDNPKASFFYLYYGTEKELKLLSAEMQIGKNGEAFMEFNLF